MSGKSQFVKKLNENRDCLDFTPVNLGNNLIDHNPDNYNLDEMKKAIEEEVCLNLPKFFMDNRESLFIEHCHWSIVYQLEIIFPDGNQKWFFDFSDEKIQAKLGRNPLANSFSAITASSLYGLIKGIKGWDYTHIGGNHRNFHKIYLATPHGIIQPKESVIKNPIDLKFPYQDIFERVQLWQVEQWKQSSANKSDSYQNKTLMMKINNTLVRLPKKNDNSKTIEFKRENQLQLVLKE